MTQITGRILVVDDQTTIRELLSTLLRQRGFTVESASDGMAAITLLDQGSFDTIVSDINMPGMDGMALLRRVRERDLDVPVILMTGLPSIESAAEAVAYGALRYFMKPLDLSIVAEAVGYGVKVRKMAELHRQAAAHLGIPIPLPSDRAGLEARFALALRGVWMAYQPIICHSKREVYAYEALVRSNEETMAGPATLLDTAERLGRMPDLGRAIRSRVADVSLGGFGAHLTFVNLHPDDLLDDQLFALAEPFAGLAHNIVLEITERASLEGIRDLSNRVAKLRGMGFRLAVDDMGAGYSGLSTLVHLTPDVVKLDMSLIRGVNAEKTKQRLVRSMAELCADMGILVVAEGVETFEEQDALTNLGCDLLQGYLYAKPSPPFVQPTWVS